jgi:hypothetical protein
MCEGCVPNRSKPIPNTISPNMKALYGRLSKLGFPKPYVRSTILPPWWDDEAGASEAGFTEALMLVSRHIGVDLSDLQASAELPTLGRRVPAKFKKAKGVSTDAVAVARSLATQVACFVSSAMSAPVAMPPSAAELREAILDSGEPWVALGSLVDACWARGIPVLHVSNFPRAARKMDGLAARIGGRPIIIISKEQKQPAWLLFILAHELGHIASGHVDADQVWVDEKVDADDADDDEREANRYAVELLTGSPVLGFVAEGRWPNARQLAEAAQEIGRAQQVDPGHVVLNYGKTMGPTFFAVANAALSHLYPNADAVAVLREKMADKLDWSALTEEGAEFVARMTGLDADDLTP